MPARWPWEPKPLKDPVYQAYLDKLHEIIQKHPYILRYSDETYRGIVLAICGMLDRALFDALKRHLVDDQEQVGQLFGEIGPLGSFAARARLAYLLGFYGKLILDEMVTVNRIRNRMAHEPEVNNLNHPRVKDQVSKLVLFSLTLSKKSEWPEQAKQAMSLALSYGWNEKDKEYHFLFSAVLLIGVMAKTPLVASTPIS